MPRFARVGALYYRCARHYAALLPPLRYASLLPFLFAMITDAAITLSPHYFIDAMLIFLRFFLC